jgi:hypothetical protein
MNPVIGKQQSNTPMRQRIKLEPMLNKPNQPVKALPEAIFYDKRFSDTQPEAFNIYQQ